MYEIKWILPYVITDYIEYMYVYMYTYMYWLQT